MNYLDYINPELFILVPVLNALGSVFKNTNKIPDRLIPAILTVISIGFTLLYVFAVDGVTLTGVFTALVQGILCSAVAVYGNQLIKQIKKSD